MLTYIHGQCREQYSSNSLVNDVLKLPADEAIKRFVLSEGQSHHHCASCTVADALLLGGSNLLCFHHVGQTVQYTY